MNCIGGPPRIGPQPIGVQPPACARSTAPKEKTPTVKTVSASASLRIAGVLLTRTAEASWVGPGFVCRHDRWCEEQRSPIRGDARVAQSHSSGRVYNSPFIVWEEQIHGRRAKWRIYKRGLQITKLVPQKDSRGDQRILIAGRLEVGYNRRHIPINDSA